MSAPTSVSMRRYRRRVVALGAAAFLVIFALGVVITMPRVQNDLADRVEDELVARDIVGVSASFSGQDGTLRCEEPLDEPDQAVRVSNDVRGVRAIDVDTTCVAGDDIAETESTETSVSTADESQTEETAAAETTTAPSSTNENGENLVSIVEVLAEDPLFDQLSDLVEDVALDGEDLLGVTGPITLFAPTDAAFDEAFDTLGADTFGAMTSDPDLVRSLLRLHIADGAVTSDAFGDGPIEMLDGSTIVVDAAIPTFSSAGSTVGVADPDTQLDIRASNGVVHAIDGILIPADFPLPTESTVPESEDEVAVEVVRTDAEYADGRVLLTGAISSEEQRDRLRAAAETNVHPENVVDELRVIDDEPLTTDIDDLALALETVVGNLVSGQATLVDGELSVTGIPVDDDARDAVDELVAAEGVAVELSSRPIADEQSATALQEELNEFVRANPIEFEPETIDLTPASIPIVDQVAARSLRLQGTDIVVVGFTDTAGSAPTNQLLSEGRAMVVRDVMVARGVPGDSITSGGFGENAPILRPDGTEDGVASRRVEFGVTSR